MQTPMTSVDMTVPSANQTTSSIDSSQSTQLSDENLAKVMRRQRWQDFFFHKLTLGFAALVLIVLLGIIFSLFIRAVPAMQEFGLAFITTIEWDPVNDKYGGLIAIVGTLITSIIALLIAFPVSFGIALFLTEICPAWLKRPLGTAIELLAGVPSIVSVMCDLFEVVPPVLKESAYGLGCTKWEVVRKIVLPYTKIGVVGCVMLGLGRALGETMAITFVIGNANQLSWSLFAAGNSIASTLANEFAEAETPLHVSSLFLLGLILFVITFIVLSAAKLMLLGLSRKEGTK